jgi:peptide/nickel transport system substrate-binding protein
VRQGAEEAEGIEGARRIQEQVFQDVAHVPTGRWRDLMAYRRNVTSMLSGMPLFYNLKKG